MNIFTNSTDGEPALPLRLSYHGRSHYNVLFDPTIADVGEGLGLPGLQPGQADVMQMEQAVYASEESALEAQLLYEAATAHTHNMPSGSHHTHQLTRYAQQPFPQHPPKPINVH